MVYLYKTVHCVSRGTVESVRFLGTDDPGQTLSTKVVQRLTAAYETLRECAGVFTQLSYREHAAEAHKECAYILRSVARHFFMISSFMSPTNVDNIPQIHDQ